MIAEAIAAATLFLVSRRKTAAAAGSQKKGPAPMPPDLTTIPDGGTIIGGDRGVFWLREGPPSTGLVSAPEIAPPPAAPPPVFGLPMAQPPLPQPAAAPPAAPQTTGHAALGPSGGYVP
jgi:hypothetical protein